MTTDLPVPPPEDDPERSRSFRPRGGRVRDVSAGRSPLPTPRGELSAWLLDQLRTTPGPLPFPPDPPVEHPLASEDHTLALYLLYELHYLGLEGVDDGWEWNPDLLRLRMRLEDQLESAVRDAVGPVRPDSSHVAEQLRAVLEDSDGPSLSGHLTDDPAIWKLREFTVHRSAYQLKEADPHTWAIPRFDGPTKAALCHIQFDEYGSGELQNVHSELFALSMRELGLDDRYGHYLDHIPATTLAGVNLVTMFGLHRRLRGALLGHLALFEMASTGPMAAYSHALLEAGTTEWARLFYDTHVVADADHQEVAAYDLAGSAVEAEPDLLADVLFGARALDLLEGRAAAAITSCWEAGASSLRMPLAQRDEARDDRTGHHPGDGLAAAG